MSRPQSGNDFRARLDGAKALASRLTPVQKIALGAATLTVVAGALVLTRGGAGPAMSALYTDLDAADAAAVVDELGSRGVRYELTDAGHTVLVPQDQVYDLRVSLAGDGLPRSNDGYALLDDQGITTSEFRQRIDYQRALEGELSMTLRSMEGIDSAAVHLALPEESVFVDEPANPTASVLLVGAGTNGISGDEVEAVVHLVSSSVRNMRPEDVTVIDANGAVLSANGTTSGAATSSGTRAKVVGAFEQELAASITALLSTTTGPNKVAVTVSAELDLDQRQSTSEDFGLIEGGLETGDDGGVVSERTTTEVYGPGAEGGTTGVLGPDGAEVTPQNPVADNGYAREDADRAYVLDRVVEQTTEAPGRILGLNVAVVLDDQAVTEAEAIEIERIVEAAAGIDPARGDTVVVTRLPFDTSARTEADALVAADEAALAEERRMELIRTLAVAFVVLVALALAYRSARRARRVTATPIDIGEITAAPRGALAERELVAVGAPSATAVGPTSAATIALTADRNDDAMTEIAKIADRRPEEVANVLRSWLAESKGRRP